MRIVGRDGASLSEYWSEGPKTYLGLGVPGFPNLFVVTGPGSPSVLANMVLGAEQHVDWIADCIEHLWEKDHDAIEASVPATEQWVEHCRELAAQTLFPLANSWYMGANIPGKPRVFMPYLGGFARVRADLRGRRGGGVPRFRVQPVPDEAGRPGGIVSQTLVSRAGNCLRG